MMNQFIRLLTAIHREEGPLGIQIGRKFGVSGGMGIMQIFEGFGAKHTNFTHEGEIQSTVIKGNGKGLCVDDGECYMK